MRRPRQTMICVLLLAVLAGAVPAVALAQGGGSAGDQQYTDPFAATSHTTPTATTSPAPATTSAPAPSTTASTVAAVTSTAQPSASAVATTPTMSSHPAQLAYTGYDEWLAGSLGVLLVGGGVLLRRLMSGA